MSRLYKISGYATDEGWASKVLHHQNLWKYKRKSTDKGWVKFVFLPRNQIRPKHHVMGFLVCHKFDLNHTIFSRFDISNPKFVSISHQWFLGFKEHMGSDLSKLLLFFLFSSKQKENTHCSFSGFEMQNWDEDEFRFGLKFVFLGFRVFWVGRDEVCCFYDCFFFFLNKNWLK